MLLRRIVSTPELTGKNHPILDVDDVPIDGDREVGTGNSASEATTEVGTLFLLKLRNTEQLRRAAVVVEYPYFKRLTIHKDCGGRVEVELVQGGGAEAGTGCGAEGPVVRNFVAGGQFAVYSRAEVAVVLEARGYPEQKLIGKVGFEVAVKPNAVAEGVDFIIGAETGKYLGATGTRAAERIEDGTDWALSVANKNGISSIGFKFGGQAVVGITSFFTGVDAVVLQAVFAAEGNVEASEDVAEVDAYLEVGGNLRKAETAGVEGGR